jgi:glutaconate CoA-transferase subunit A
LERKQVIIGEKEAVDRIKDGMTIALGGFLNSSHPMALIRQIVKNRIKRLTIVGSPLSSLDVDLLIAAGCVTKVIAPYVGAGPLSPVGPFYRWAAEQGKIEIWECDEGIYYAGLRAAAQMLPFAPWRGGVGTDYPKVNPDIKVFSDPIKGQTLLAIPAIEPDIFITHAAFGDCFGNVQHIGTGFADKALYRAADHTIVEVEKVIENAEVRKDPIRTTIPFADAIVHAPFGSHPFANPGFYLEDAKHLEEYIAAANAFTKRGENKLFEEYLNYYIIEPENNLDYLERIGLRRLLSLVES